MEDLSIETENFPDNMNVSQHNDIFLSMRLRNVKEEECVDWISNLYDAGVKYFSI